MRKIRSARHRGVLFRAKSYKFLDSLQVEMNFTEEIAPDKGIESHRPRSTRRRAGTTLSMEETLKFLEEFAIERNPVSFP